MTRHGDVAGSLKAGARLLGASLAAFFALAATVDAGEMKIPRGHPQVALDVPDDWTIERSSFAVEMRSPDKSSIVVASVLAENKSGLDAWTKQAGEKLKAFGIQFDPNAKAPPKPAETSTKPAEDVKADQVKKAEADAKSAFTTDPDAFTFSGTPSLKMPGTEGSNKPVKPADNSIENLTGFGASAPPTAAASAPQGPKPKLPFRAVQIYGASMNGKPVDVQLVIYTLPANHLFVMMQESGPDDGRAVAMAQSVRGAN